MDWAKVDNGVPGPTGPTAPELSSQTLVDVTYSVWDPAVLFESMRATYGSRFTMPCPLESNLDVPVGVPQADGGHCGEFPARGSVECVSMSVS
jgi:hypothetical protein